MAERPARERKPKAAPPPKPWTRVEAGRYRSSDERFTLESGGGAWFVTDAEALDELGLARTTGPFATLDAAKVAADLARERPAAASPLAARLAEASSRPLAARVPAPAQAPARGPAATSKAGARPAPAAAVDGEATARRASQAEGAPARTPAGKARAGKEPEAKAEPAPPPRTWLDDLEDADRDRAIRARKLIAALEREGITDAEAVVRRDLLGGTPAVATRLLARAVLAAIGGLRNPSAATVAEAVAAALASSPKRGGLPGWELTERDGPNGERRGLRVTADDLRAAAESPDRD